MLPRLLMLSIALAGFAGLAAAQMMPPPQRTITVTATAQRQVTPDLAYAVLAVETQANSVAAATTANNTAANKVIAAIRALNIPNLTIRTLGFDVQPIYEQPKPGVSTPPRLTGYRVTNRVQARIPDADAERLSTNTGHVLDAALNAGANRVDQVTFDLQDPQHALREVLADATRNAHETVSAMAAAAGVTLGPLQSLSSQPVYVTEQLGLARAADMASAPEVPIMAGLIPISATVTAVYLIQ